MQLGGPIWAEPIHDQRFVADLLGSVKAAPATAFGTKERMTGLLTLVSEVTPRPPSFVPSSRRESDY